VILKIAFTLHCFIVHYRLLDDGLFDWTVSYMLCLCIRVILKCYIIKFACVAFCAG